MRLSAGPLSMAFDPELGFLRHVSLGGRELVRAVYAAVRDENWGTEPVRLLDHSLVEEAGGFRLEWTLAAGDALTWRGVLTGRPEGIVDYEVTGEVHRPYRSRRTGICLLHPPTLAGEEAVLHHSDDTMESSAFPDSVAPDQPFFDLAGIEHPAGEGVRLRIGFRGETFETEDQRNWTDASYKTYCRPQSRPQPFDLTPGEPVTQGVRIFLVPPASGPARPPVPVRTREKGTMPRVGTVLAPGEPDDAALAPLDFLAVRAGDAAGFATARRLGKPVVVLVDGEEIGGGEEVEAVILQDAGSRGPSAARVAAARAAYPGGRVLYGSADNFTELNRSRPTGNEGYDGGAFAANPQVHAFDAVTILETPEVYGRIVADLGRIVPGPVTVGPVSFGSRFSGEDDRLGTDLGADFARRVIARAAVAGAERVILFESHGVRGIAGRPVAAVLAEAAAGSGRPVTVTTTGAWPDVPAVALD